ncbi:MAG: hypothetical protein AAB530_00940 [Patescibacteria group bacterium]
MKINFTKKQYEHLILINQLAGSTLGILGDEVDDRYKKDSDENEIFESYILGFAKDFGMKKFTDNFHGQIVLKDELYEKYYKITNEYDEFIMWDELAHMLARRDFYKTTSKEELKECKKVGLLNKRFRDLVNKYWEEFENNGPENIEIKKLII